MSVFQKSFIGIFFILLSVFVSISIISANMDADHAKAFKENVVTQIEDSDFNARVINACITEAEKQQYALSVTVYREDGTKETYTDATAADTSDACMAEIILNYTYKIAFLNVETDHEARGFAR